MRLRLGNVMFHTLPPCVCVCARARTCVCAHVCVRARVCVDCLRMLPIAHKDNLNYSRRDVVGR